jgi:hypothetical protein
MYLKFHGIHPIFAYIVLFVRFRSLITGRIYQGSRQKEHKFRSRALNHLLRFLSTELGDIWLYLSGMLATV